MYIKKPALGLAGKDKRFETMTPMGTKIIQNFIEMVLIPLEFAVELQKKEEWSLVFLLKHKCMQNMHDVHGIKCFDIMTLD